MGFTDRIASWFRRSRLDKPEPWLVAAVGGAQSAAGEPVSAETGRALSAAYACVDLRARLIASLPLKLYRKAARGRTEQPDHPASRLLRTRPNGAQTPYQFLTYSQSAIDMRGNAVARIVRDRYFRPTALIPLQPGKIDPLMTAAGDVVFRHEGALLTRADILHVPGNDLRADGLWGVSPVTRLRETFGLALATEHHAARLLGNDTRPPLLLRPKSGKLTEQQMKDLRYAWEVSQAGPSRGRVGVVPFDLEATTLGFNPQDTQLLESRAFDVDQIARAFGVPGELIGAKGASSWGTGIGEKIQGFVKFTIGPQCVGWEQALDLSLLTEAERADGYFFAFNLDALLRGDLKARAEIYKILREIAAIDVNQIRELEDWELYPDAWAGDPRTPLNNQGGRSEPAAKPAPASRHA